MLRIKSLLIFLTTFTLISHSSQAGPIIIELGDPTSYRRTQAFLDKYNVGFILTRDEISKIEQDRAALYGAHFPDGFVVGCYESLEACRSKANAWQPDWTLWLGLGLMMFIGGMFAGIYAADK